MDGLPIGGLVNAAWAIAQAQQHATSAAPDGRVSPAARERRG
jgi:hypothetical protein